MAYEDSMAEALGIHLDAEEIPTEITSLSVIQPSEVIQTVAPSETVDIDFNLARQNITHITEKGQLALDMVVDLAIASEHPRAFEVVAQMMSALSSANKDLMSLHVQRESLNKINSNDTPSHSSSEPSVVNNIIFNGSTKELQEILSKRRLKTIEEESS